MIKSHTDIEQSIKLAEILLTESADMYYPCEGVSPKFGVALSISNNIPCWSLAALLDIIPQELFGGEYIINITEGLDSKWIVSYNANNSASFYGLVASADNLVDACIDIIERLHERKML